MMNHYEKKFPDDTELSNMFYDIVLHVYRYANIAAWLVQLLYTRYFLSVLYFVDNLSGRIFAFKFSLMPYL